MKSNGRFLTSVFILRESAWLVCIRFSGQLIRRYSEGGCHIEGFLVPAHWDLKNGVAKLQQIGVNACDFVAEDEDARFTKADL